ncbi:hypothetical protein EDD75_0322 [Thermodesulfitimonas autotrophica]|uniref:Uncharacterized protein n=1 Tax=Thermodesulfitimonas autotrophica TaxID=1894989 RepID=A0A3N5AWA8_9THEO|nr:hypothetical protein EDD75_0322 [Thermodesulfitimonas autotrophica]
MERCCINCINVRKAQKGLPYVACAYWSLNSFEKFLDLEKKPEQIYSGWADLRSYPEGNGSGLITNNCVIIRQHDVCSLFKSRLIGIN